MIIDRERRLVGVYELSIQPHMHSPNIALALEPSSPIVCENPILTKTARHLII